MAKGLTSRQEAILQYILNYVDKEGYPPSIREIGRDFDIGSLRGVTVHLDALDRKGYISRSNTPRSIKVIHPAFQTAPKAAMLPLVGTIAAGTPILADENVEEMLPVPVEMVRRRNGAFLLRVQGESMTGEGILPGDLVVVAPQDEWVQHQLVAVRIDESATVKRVNMTKDRLQLMPSNPAFEPIDVTPEDDARVIGKIVGLLRDYERAAF